MTKRRVLVTGAAGFLGSAVVDALLDRRDVDRVVGVDVRPVAARQPRHLAVRRDVTEGVGDLLVDHEIDAVVHHAFVIRPPRDPKSAERVNVDAAARLAADGEAAGVGRIVYPSSTTVYGARAGGGLHTEDDIPRPVSGFTYSEHKVAAEQALRAAEAGGGPSVVILRGCVVAGPGATGFILESLALPVLPIVRGADPEMQFLHVDDYTAAVGSALDAADSGLYNIAGSGTVRVREMAHMVGSRALPLPGPLLRAVIRWSWRLRLQRRSPESGLAFITHPWLASTRAAEERLRWTPRHSSREAIAAWSTWRRERRSPP